jgi:hypothetical protein
LKVQKYSLIRESTKLYYRYKDILFNKKKFMLLIKGKYLYFVK